MHDDSQLWGVLGKLENEVKLIQAAARAQRLDEWYQLHEYRSRQHPRACELSRSGARRFGKIASRGSGRALVLPGPFNGHLAEASDADPRGNFPSRAALARAGHRKASEIVIETLRALQPSRRAMVSAVASRFSTSSPIHWRPRATASMRVARISERFGRKSTLSLERQDFAAAP
jgi:hypothetical protein